MNVPRRRPSILLFPLSFLLAFPTLQATAADKVPDPALVKKYAALLPERPQGVGRPIGDRQAWQNVAKAPAFQGVVARAEKLLKAPMPELTDDDYLDYSRTGNRSRGERVLGQRHSRLPQLVLAECIEDRGRFLSAIEAAIRAIAAEKSWTLPAHDGSLKNFYGTERDIDLASSALSWNLATADYWLGDKLDADVRKLVRSELQRRCFTPFRGYVLAGKPSLWWATAANNWNAVCLAGVAGSALAILDAPHERAFFAAAADQYVNHFLEGFAADGYCGEGLGYWNYGFGHFLLLSETLYQATGGKVDLIQRPKVRQIAQFGRRLEILPRIYPAFADCDVVAQPSVAITAYVSRRFGLGWQDEERQGLLLARGPTGNLFELGLMGFANSASARLPAAEAADRPLRDWFADAEILVCRPAPGSRHALGVAIKGGRNAGNHCHNDVGSYVVALGQSVPLVDPGSEVYTARTFSAHRFDSKVLNSFGHSVPRVAGELQESGAKAAAREIRTEFTPASDAYRMDIRSAYAVPELTKLVRSFVFSRQAEGSLQVTDEVSFAAAQSFGTALITFSPWKELSAGKLRIGQAPDAVEVTIATDGPSFRLVPEEIHENLHGNRLPIRLGIELLQPVRAAKVTVTIRPARDVQ
jgi:hypothetical protein